MKEPIEFFVVGEPIAMPRPRARAIRMGPKWIATIYNPKDADPWKMLVVEAFQTKWPDIDQVAFDCPVRLRLEFFMPRPKSHFLKAGIRLNAPTYHLGRPDTDNLAKAVMDALTKYAWSDDSLIVHLSIVKRYTHADGGRSIGGVLVNISEAINEG